MRPGLPLPTRGRWLRRGPCLLPAPAVPHHQGTNQTARLKHAFCDVVDLCKDANEDIAVRMCEGETG